MTTQKPITPLTAAQAERINSLLNTFLVYHKMVTDDLREWGQTNQKPEHYDDVLRWRDQAREELKALGIIV